MKHLGLFLCCLVATQLARPVWAQEKYSQQWNMVGADLTSDAGLDKFMALLKQSKDCGCNHILLGDSAWLRIPDNANYQGRVNKVKAAAKDMGIDIVPTVYAFGYSGRYLGMNPNLAAGLPVKDMPFVVKGKMAAADPADAFDLSKFKDNNYEQIFTVPKFMYYKVTLRTSAKPAADDDEPFRANSVNAMRWLTRTNPRVEQSGDEWITTNTFNSLDDDTVRFRVLVTDKSIVKDVKVELTGALSILRRDNLPKDMTPLKVTSEDGQTVYQEGKDFKRLVDTEIFNPNHTPNNIELTDDSAIKDGQKLKVSFFHAYKIYADQDSITMEDPAVYDIMEKDVANCNKVWHPDGFFMNFDEIRIGGWENPSVAPGKMLADITRRGYDDIRKQNPKATVYTWSDMYCPQQNAWPADEAKGKKYYYLINGTWAGSWDGVANDVIILNWESSVDGLKFFADRGQSQVLCGYYDATNTADMKKNITTWKTDSKDVKNILGFMYTEWGSGFGNMKEYFDLVNSYDQWSKGAN